MTLKLDSKADMKGKVIKGLKWVSLKFTIEELLQRGTNSAFYLDRYGYLRKNVKSQLGFEY